MDDSFDRWRDSLRTDGKTIVISDSEEDIDNNAGKEQILVIDSSRSSSSVSRSITPEVSSSSKKSPVSEIDIEDRIRKFIPGYSDNENQNDASCSDSHEDDMDYSISSDGSEKIITIQSKKTKKNKSLDASMKSINTMEISNITLNNESNNNSMVDGYASTTSTSTSMHTPNKRRDLNTEFYSSEEDEDVQFVKEEFIAPEFTYPVDSDSDYDINSIPTKLRQSLEMNELGARAQATLNKELALTIDRIQDLHGSLLDRPTEEQKADDPPGLKVRLMPHQQHALAWLMWREQQRPPGGVLADDMGLGKTLTMISLIVVAKRFRSTDDSSDEEWTNNKTTLKHRGGTLVVCPASLLSQWENEILNRCRRGLLSIELYHGTNRETVPKRLARNDVVITTYNILSREYKSRSTTYKIHWDRVILDEAHIVRNHKSQASVAVCGLVANKRWALSGTPIQNKEMDLYSIFKFLQCTPFDDLRVWKRWVDNRDHSGHKRLATVMNTLMLRRTKQELQDKGALQCLPDKTIEEIIVELDKQEMLIYEKVLIYSRTLFAQFLSQRAEKHHMNDLASGAYDRPTFLSNPNRNTQFTKAQNKLLSLHADVKSHEILVLLLRLRQICVHPTLIHSMLDQEDMMESGIMDIENVDPNMLIRMNSITLQDCDDNKHENDQEMGVDRRVTTNLLTSKNPVFKAERISSKMKVVLRKVEEILERNDKLIIVSQWTSMLNIVGSYLPSIKGATFSMFTGQVAIKDRQGVMDSFNSPNRDPRILLLSLTAGGVGLNLVGGNHLLLIDIHWNPQLEVQAQDRIYRFGQKKNVSIYKFICKDTIEERIQQLQEKKVEIAQSVLSGGKTSVASKLTLNDLKSLFGF
ncbi:transcription termination factor 2-like [Hylaeus anthracinus]|uniref:transcription termination factor 2-like n=1 Tax=Hylaeus anthracinus TaxID=313031 RepID=UPI0023B9DD95|nr:transcription termination factor 2-like [Hylaeus anthracinus]XP_053995797.1 transcription termination factor 2-like [Hylaeus anthracinus]XP_053995798.1 transcription termination factor 2-like [Hylaeus anthracinus]XP_053995799.1 transcription termination factor 2-like [Hylaeus anthracinus]